MDILPMRHALEAHATWQDTQGTPVLKDQFEYGYDRASNHRWRKVGRQLASPPAGKDEWYGDYDGPDRGMGILPMHHGLEARATVQADRGTLAGTHPNYTAVTSPTFKQEWKEADGPRAPAAETGPEAKRQAELSMVSPELTKGKRN